MNGAEAAARTRCPAGDTASQAKRRDELKEEHLSFEQQHSREPNITERERGGKRNKQIPKRYGE
jgi:hypothetical protein